MSENTNCNDNANNTNSNNDVTEYSKKAPATNIVTQRNENRTGNSSSNSSMMSVGSPRAVTKPISMRTPTDKQMVRKSVSFMPTDMDDEESTTNTQNSNSSDSPSAFFVGEFSSSSSPVTTSKLPPSTSNSPPRRASISKLKQRISPPTNLNIRDLSVSAPNASPISDNSLRNSTSSYHTHQHHSSSSSSNNRRSMFISPLDSRQSQTPVPKPLHSSKSTGNLLYTPQPQNPHYSREFGKSPINDYFFDLVSSDLIILEKKKRKSVECSEDDYSATSSDGDGEDDDDEEEEEEEEGIVLLNERNHHHLSPPVIKERSMTMSGGRLMQMKHLPIPASPNRVFNHSEFDSPRKKAMSLDLRKDNSWFTYKLTSIKQQTDQDLRMYISELEEMTQTKFGGSLDPPSDISPKEDVEKLLRDHIRVLKTIAQNIIDCSVQQLKDGEHKQIVKHLQRLNASLLGQEKKLREYPSVNLEKRRMVNKECSKLVRKLIFIFSRCSRLLEFLRVHGTSPSSPSMSNLAELQQQLDAIAPARGRNRVHSLMVASPYKTPIDVRLQQIGVDSPTSKFTPTKKQPSIDFDNITPRTTPTKPEDDDFVLPKIEPDSPMMTDTKKKDDTTSSIPTPSTPATPFSPGSDIESPILIKNDKNTPKPGDSFFSKIVSKWKSLVSGKPTKEHSDSDTDAPSPTNKHHKRSPSRRSGTHTIELLCRICEELVRSDELESHSKTCAIRHNIDMRSVTCDDRLKKLVKSIRKKIQQTTVDRMSRGQSLGDGEVNTLHQFSSIANRAADLKYTNENICALQSLLEELSQLQTSYHKLIQAEAALSTVDVSGRELSVPIRRDSLSSLSSNALTLDIFCKRIEEVMKVKLKTMQERMQLSPNVRVNRVSITDFEIMKPISKGAFGRVFLAKKKKTGDMYAIKVLKKRDMIRKNQTKRVIAERNIMAAADTDFVVRFYYSFSGKEYLYIVMEYCPGGDLFSLLKEKEQFECDMIRQYAAEIVLALEHLHSKGIVHRDLKPDNILIGQDGHIKLTDFGLSEFGLIDRDPFMDDDDSALMDMTVGSASPPSYMTSPTMSDQVSTPNGANGLTAQGTPDYLAPELLLGNEHSYPVDYWALGCIIYEFLYGIPPFNATSPSEIFDNILSMNIEWPDLGDPAEDDEEMRDIRVCTDLARKLLNPDPAKRLDANGVKNHEFFNEINWDKILTQEPPFIPQPVTEEDTRYFNARMPLYPVSEEEGAALMNDSVTISPSNDGSRPTENGRSGRSGSVMSSGSDHLGGSFDDITSPNMSSSMDFSFGNVQHYANLAHKTRQQLQLLAKKGDLQSSSYENPEGATNTSSYSSDSALNTEDGGSTVR